jgi:uncharacterized protein (DUF433 family)
MTDHIIEDEQMGGAPRLKGHRIAVYHIVEYRDAGYSPQEISDEFDIEVALVEEALEYANTHDIE